MTLTQVNATISAVIKGIFESFIDLLYPPSCLLCRNAIPIKNKEIILCAPCLNAIQPNQPPFCKKCSRSLQGYYQTPLCFECRNLKPHFNFAYASCYYNDSMRKLIHLFKYGQKTALQYFFTELIDSFLKIYKIRLSHFDLLVPVPLHSVRLRERGYNQAHLLAKNLSKKLNIKLAESNIIRIKNTKNQAVLSQKDRWTNIQGAFRIKQPSAFLKRSVLLIDDLLTTGATASECAKILKAHGAKKVGVLTVAIAV